MRKQTNQVETTDHYFGGYMGLESGYDVVQKGNNELQIVGGLGLDGFDALTQSGELNAVSTFSYNVNIGMKFRKYIKSNSYIGVGLRYNFVDYRIGNKLDFNEYPVSVNISYGFVENRLKSQRLNQINYNLRE